MAVAATAANTVQPCWFSEVGRAMGKVHYFQIMWKNKYGLVIFLLSLLLGIICTYRHPSYLELTFSCL